MSAGQRRGLGQGGTPVVLVSICGTQLWQARRYSPPNPYIKLPARHEVLPCKKRLRVRLIRCYICAERGEITGVNFSENGERFENANETPF